MKHTEEISHQQLKALLQEGIVSFSFYKKNGELRRSNGTTNLDEIDEFDHPITGAGSPDSVTVFYDTDKEAWRSISINSEVFI